MQELKKELNDKDISLNEYKKSLANLDDINKQEIEKVKKELKESDIKDKSKVLKKINELNELNNKYKEELNKKEQEINNLKTQKQLLKQESDNLKNEIKELKKVKRSSTSPKMFQSVRKKDDKARTFAPKEPEAYQTIENIDGLPEYDEESDRSKNLREEYIDTTEENPYISG